MAVTATNVYFLMWCLLDQHAVEQKITTNLDFYEFMAITNGALIIISLFSITYKNLGDTILEWGYSNAFRFVVLILLSIFIFALACIFLLAIHFHINASYSVTNAISNTVLSPFFGSLIVFFSLVSILMFFISNLERRSGNMFRLMSQSMGNSLKPKLVRRGFMFIDLNDATSLAEKLSSQHYANLLRDCFRLLNELVDVSPFEIYQYVGDEAVITWEMDISNADLKALQLFADFKAYLEENKEAFKKGYGTQPKFKCSIHSGEVVQSEIGKEVRHLVYHGDVLNTASRLLSQCHDYHTDVIISKGSVSNIKNVAEKYDLNLMVCDNLKGKENSIEAFVVTPKDNAATENTSETITFFLASKVTVGHFINNESKVLFKQ